MHHTVEHVGAVCMLFLLHECDCSCSARELGIVLVLTLRLSVHLQYACLRAPIVTLAVQGEGEVADVVRNMRVTFKRDGTTEIPTAAGVGLRWRLDPGPTHLDTISVRICICLYNHHLSAHIQYTGVHNVMRTQ
jgi:hypothetical protein